ncbi:YidC/Oxa1 family membrane protein insertase [Candidatus Margulisiibacteriota bacterium]
MQTVQTGNILIDLTFPALEFFFQITRNYGWAIIFLTVAVRAALYPLSAKQYESMSAMQKIQPRLKEVQSKHSKDPQKMQQETLLLYKEHGVNPLGGCLPVLLQLPIIIALFATLNNPEVQGVIRDSGAAGTFFWIKDFALAEWRQPALIGLVDKLPLLKFLSPLVLLVGLSTYLTQKTMSANTESSQTKMMAFMPIFMLFICANLPTGVLLYWCTSNSLMAAQQYFLSKQKMVKEKVAVIEVENTSESEKSENKQGG